MSAPGTQVTIRDETLGRFVANDTAAWFVTGFTEKGPSDAPVAIRSLAEFVDIFGARVSYSALYDALDVFFREGGGRAYVQRVVGDAPVHATVNLFDQTGSSAPGDVALTFTASEYGDWANKLNVVADYGTSNVVLQITHDDDGVLVTSPTFTTRAEIVAWENGYGTFGLGASNELPRDQTVSLASGTDDHGSAAEANWTAALAKFNRDYGPGQVSAPGRTTDAAHTALADHAFANDRIALLDLVDVDDVSTLTAAAATVRATGHGRSAASFSPWVTVPGLLAGTTRTVPPSALVAGLIARSESLGNSSNVAVAGANGQAGYATALTQPAFTDDERDTLNTAGVNVIREIRGLFRVYGYRTLADPDSQPNWRELGGARVTMAIAHEANAIAEEFAFSEIDGRGIRIGEFRGRLESVCLGYYSRNALYGDSPQDAFFVDTTVNTPETIDEGKLLASIELRTSPTAERVEITIIKTS